MLISAFVSDLDGTMWSTDMSMHPETLAVVPLLENADIPLLIATGRRAQSALIGLAMNGLDRLPGILMNGALARDSLRGESFLSETIAPADARSVLIAFLELGLEPVVYIDHPEVDMIVGSDPAASPTYVANAPGVRTTIDLETVVDEDPVIGFGAFGFPRAVLDAIAKAIDSAESASAIVAESLYEGDHGLMIQGLGVDKITGISAWCRRHGVDETRLAVIGDGANDIGMLSAAAFAIVPANAPDDVRAIADHVIPPADEGGWSEIGRMLNL